MLDTVSVFPEFEFNPVAVLHVTSFKADGPPRDVRSPNRPPEPPPAPVAGPCDSCQYAIVIAGGVNARNNHARYWNDVIKKRNYLLNKSMACESNVTTLYYDGTQRNGAIANDKLTKATEANFNAAVAAIKAKIQAKEAMGKKSSLQLLVTNHGEKDTGAIHLFGAETLTPSEVKAKMKELIDAGLDELSAEFGECYGGHQVDTLKTLADSTTTTSFHLASAARHDQPSRGDTVLDSTEVDVFEDRFITALNNGKSWSQAFACADSADSADYENNKATYQGWGGRIPAS